ncbi:lycopene cyclase (CrtL-type) [Actinokineospora alba]|uniref:Lycopene cyclase (CrtL-type) n=1 Tax=Actinokineospora alba TaxID=504798 RepID=A0A1H0WEY7_9PSEU|nr:lycopene beta-cyclase [Actinokineospora alba]SDI75510.1 lycopene beta-cyclase [Actinokineospora alba]SDP89158.1 lycopene cyclase (CrtL-type) [Actinokineospora alba]
MVGAGPAGWAVAYHCAGLGLRTGLVDPDPYGPWAATYGVWDDQCAFLPPEAQVTRATAVRAAGRRLERGYRVLHNESVLAGFARSDVTVFAGRVRGAEHGPRGSTITLDDGRRIACAVTVDASGARRVLTGGSPRPPRTEQTAFGVIVSAKAASAFVAPGEAVFMDDWITANGLATFLYAVPLPGNRVLLEETSLAARPGVARDVLVSRLRSRGISLTDETEWVRFALDIAPPWGGDVVAFGAAGGMIHPATGYSLGDALAVAPQVAGAIAAALPDGPAKARAAARAAVWSPAARVVHGLRLRGLRTLTALPAERFPAFFDTFFALPADLRDAYLTGRDDVRGTTAAMAALFRDVPWRIRRTMAILR